MPEYLYICTVADQEFDAVHSIKVELEECPICKEKGLENHKPKRLIGSATPGKVILTGHELVAKTNQEIKEMKHRAKTDPNYLANIIGESKYESNLRRDKK